MASSSGLKINTLLLGDEEVEVTDKTVSKVGDIRYASLATPLSSTEFAPLNGRLLVKADEAALFSAVGYTLRPGAVTTIAENNVDSLFGDGDAANYLQANSRYLVFFDFFNGNIVAVAPDSVAQYIAEVTLVDAGTGGVVLTLGDLDGEAVAGGIIVGKGTDHERLLFFGTGANTAYIYSDHQRDIATPAFTTGAFGAGLTLHAAAASSRFNPASDQLYAVLVGGDDDENARITTLTFEDTAAAADATVNTTVTSTDHLRAAAYLQVGDEAASDFFVVGGDDGVLLRSAANFGFSTFSVPNGYDTDALDGYSYRHLAYHQARETLYGIVEDGDNVEYLIAFPDLTDLSTYTLYPAAFLPGTGVSAFKYEADLQKLAMSFGTNNVADATQPFALSDTGSSWQYVDVSDLEEAPGPFFSLTVANRLRFYWGAGADVGATEQVAAFGDVTDYNPATQFRLPFVSSGETQAYVRYN